MTLDASGVGADVPPGLNLSETLQECLVTGILGVDHSSRVSIFTPGAEILLHVKAAHILQQPYNLLPRPLPSILQQAQESSKHLPEQSLTLEDPHGGRRSLRLSLSPVCRREGERHGVMAMIHDMDAMQRMEAQLRRLDRLASIGTMSASFAHEIKNALTPVKTFVELANLKDPGSELGPLVNREVDRVAAIVGQMLRFAGPARTALVDLSLHQLLDQCLELMRHQLEAKGIQVSLNKKASGDGVAADSYQMEQALLNILINAIEAMQPGGALSLTTCDVDSEEDGDPIKMIRLNIEDSGQGIEPVHMDRLFDTFFTTKPNGTGLGLAITRRIIKEHRGRIRIESQWRSGTCVTIELPRSGGGE